MIEMICIVCPVGCSLAVEKNDDSALIISGNKCPRGIVYANEEITAPKRVVTATCAISGNKNAQNPLRRVPVKTNIPCPREKIKLLLADIYKTSVTLPVRVGDKVITNWDDSSDDGGIDVIVTRNVG